MGKLKAISYLQHSLMYIATYNIPCTDSRMFTYTDKICLLVQDKEIQSIERTLASNISQLVRCFRKWRRRTNPYQTITTAFHLKIKEAKNNISVYIYIYISSAKEYIPKNY